VNAPERFSLDEALEAFEPQRELTQGQRSFTRQTPLPQTLEVLGQGVLGPVDDPQILAPRHLTAGCNRPREPVATNDNGLTTAPSPPLSVNAVHHPVAAASLAGSARSTI